MEGVKAIARLSFPRLNSLNVLDAKLTDATFKELMKTHMPRLGTIIVSHNFIGNEAVDALVHANFTNMT